MPSRTTRNPSNNSKMHEDCVEDINYVIRICEPIHLKNEIDYLDMIVRSGNKDLRKMEDLIPNYKTILTYTKNVAYHINIL